MAILKSGSVMHTVTSPQEGFLAGGRGPNPAAPPPVSDKDIVEKFPFAAAPVTTTDVGELSVGRDNLNGHSSATEGFVSGGSLPPYHIERFPLSASPFTATNEGGLATQRSYSAGHSALTEGFVSGGYSGPSHDSIDRFSFSAPPYSATDAGELTVARNTLAGYSTSSEGFSVGGAVPTPAYSDVIDKFPFSAAPITSTDVGELTVATAYIAGGTQSPTYAYNAGGTTAAVPTGLDDVSRFPFSAPPITITDVGELPATRYETEGQSSETNGYVSGGFSGGFVDTILSFPFSAPVAPVTDIGELSVAGAGVAGIPSAVASPQVAIRSTIKPSDFGPGTVGDVLIQGLDGSLKWQTGGVLVPQGFGTVAGYTSGGANPAVPTTETDIIDSFPFTSPFATATDVGELTSIRTESGGQSSSTNGYTACGYAVPTGTTDTIDSFAFGSPPITATDIGELGNGRRTGAGYSSETTGYHSGSITSDRIDSFPFSAPPVSGTDIGNLSQARGQAGSSSSAYEGFTSGGFASPTPEYASTIDKFPFTTPFTTATDSGELSAQRYSLTGHASALNGFTSGGRPATPPTTTYVDTVDKFPFVSPFVTATDIGEMTGVKYAPAGISSDSTGFSAGGRAPPVGAFVNTIYSFPFNSPPFSAVDAGDLSTGREYGAGQWS